MKLQLILSAILVTFFTFAPEVELILNAGDPHRRSFDSLDPLYVCLKEALDPRWARRKTALWAV